MKIAFVVLLFVAQIGLSAEMELSMSFEEMGEIQKKLTQAFPGAYTEIWATEETHGDVRMVVVHAEMADGLNRAHFAVEGTGVNIHQQVQDAVSGLIKLALGGGQ